MSPSDQATNPPQLVFAYGTLKRGFNNNRILRDCRFLGNAATCEKFSLWLAGLPFVRRTPATSHVKGEVYSVDSPTLAVLDALEGHPQFYRRELVKVVLEGGPEVSAWLYFLERNRGTVIQSGEFTRAHLL